MNKLTVEEVQQIVNQLNIQALSFFIKNKRTYFNLKCCKCNHEWNVSSASIRKIVNCPNCLKKARRKTTKEFAIEVKEITNGDYELVGDYITNKEKVKIRHNICNNIYPVRPDLFISGSRCPFCSSNNSVSKEEFLDRLSNAKGKDYQLIGDYINTSIKIKIRHICGYQYEAMPLDVLKYSCAKCAGNIKKTTEQFKQEVYNLVGNEYTILGEYYNTHTKIPIQHNCQECNNFKWNIEPNAFLRGNRCPVCNQSKGEKRIEKYLIENNFIKNRDYISQKQFEGLIGLSNGNLSYDFYLLKYNLLIEYQGQQHAKYIKGFHKSKKDFDKQIKHDRRKQEYADNHNIKLLPIWYYDFDNIEKILKEKI